MRLIERLKKIKRKNGKYTLITHDDFKAMMLDEKCNRICVWCNEKQQYKRFDFVGWEERKGDANEMD